MYRPEYLALIPFKILEISCVITKKNLMVTLSTQINRGSGKLYFLCYWLCCLASDSFCVLENILVSKLLPSIFTKFSITCVRDLLMLLFTR